MEDQKMSPWEMGYKAGYERRSGVPPEGIDPLGFFAGFLKGLEDRKKGAERMV